MINCGAPDPTAPLAERLAGYLDCHAQAIAQNGFSGFTGGWLGPALLAGCLTIYVALIGYRLLLGLPFGPRDALLAAVRAGVIIALATSWSAYETLVYRVVLDGPAEVARLLLPGDAVIASPAEAAQRLDKDLSTLRDAASVGSAAQGSVPGQVPGSPGGPAGISPTASSSQANTPPPDPILTGAGANLASVTVGFLSAIRLAGGLILGVGPLFIILALFNAAIGLFEGWLRALVTTFVAAAGAMLVASLELGFIESDMIGGVPFAQDLQQSLEPSLNAIAALFSLAMLAVLVAAFLVGGAVRLRRSSGLVREAARAVTVTERALHPGWQNLEPASRADVVVDAVRRLTRRDEAMAANSHTTLETHLRAPGGMPAARAANGGSLRGDRTEGLGRRTTPAQASGLQRREPPK